jgi:hypothetical protein
LSEELVTAAVHAFKAKVITPANREGRRTEMQWVVLEENLGLAVAALRRTAPHGSIIEVGGEKLEPATAERLNLRRGVPRLLAKGR